MKRPWWMSVNVGVLLDLGPYQLGFRAGLVDYAHAYAVNVYYGRGRCRSLVFIPTARRYA